MEAWPEAQLSNNKCQDRRSAGFSYKQELDQNGKNIPPFPLSEDHIGTVLTLFYRLPPNDDDPAISSAQQSNQPACLWHAHAPTTHKKDGHSRYPEKMEERGVPCVCVSGLGATPSSARRSWKKKRQSLGLVDLLKGCRDPPACFFIVWTPPCHCHAPTHAQIHTQIARIKYHTTVQGQGLRLGHKGNSGC